MTSKIVLGENLELPKCPHCRIDNPNLSTVNKYSTTNHQGGNRRYWKSYVCQRCGGAVIAHSGNKENGTMVEFFPQLGTISEALPEKAASFLQQAHDSLHAPSGCIMLCASAVDEMLKQRDFKDGTLYKRIKEASEDGILTSEMEAWAHEVRLDANDERHADEDASLPNENDAKKVLNFTDALAEYLFVLPSRVKRGLGGNDIKTKAKKE